MAFTLSLLLFSYTPPTPIKEIAKELSITERTVKYHIGLILERLQLRSRYELARYAQEQGFTAK